MALFAWWTWRLHEAHSGWQWLTGLAAFLGFASMMGSRTPVQAPSAETAETVGTAEPKAVDSEPTLGDLTPLAPRGTS